VNDHKLLQNERLNELLTILENCFTKNMYLHQELEWSKIHTKVESNPSKAWTINEMEVSGGEPNVIGQGKKQMYLFLRIVVPNRQKNVEAFVTILKH